MLFAPHHGVWKMLKTAYRPTVRSQISHELRIPLTSIMGMVYLLNSTQLTEQQKEYLNFIQASAERLLLTQNKIEHFLSEEKNL